MNEYKKFSYYYDEVMSSLNYDLWLEFIEPYLKHGDSILDLACGTGTFATMLKLKGFDVDGLDLSDSIIEIALEKSKINHLKIPFYVADMTNFSLNKTYNVITCFFDSVNFLKNNTEIEKMLNHVYTHLKPNGLFIFDLFSKTMLQEYKDHFIDEDYKTFQLIWKSNLESPTKLAHHIKIVEGDLCFEERYYEYYHEIKSLNLKGFKLLKISGDFNDDLQDEDERILIVLQRL